MKIDNSIALLNLKNIPQIKIENENDALLKEQTDKFEAFFIKQVLEIAMDDKNPLFPKDPGDKIYQSMYQDAISGDLSGNFGYSELLYNFLKENR